MIQEIKIKNFLSFKEEVTFSFEATKDTFAEEYQVVEVKKSVRLLRFAMIYGANASGKSNLLQAFDFLHRFWFDNPDNIDEETGSIPFKLDSVTPNEPSHFELIFYVGSTKYWYQLELDEKQVYFEKLFFYQSVQPTMLFERELKDGLSIITFNPLVIKISTAAKEKISVECLKNMSFFAARDKVNISIPKIDVAKEWMKNHIMPIINPDTKLFNYAEQQSFENSIIRTHILEFLRKADFNITNFTTDVVAQKIPEYFLKMVLNAQDISEQEKERIKEEKTIKQIKTNFEHTITNDRGQESFLLPKRLESIGTIRTFGIETAIFNALQKESFLSIDELENSLHPQLLKFILFNFLNEKSQSQLLITTHYDPLLNDIEDLFRKDSVWFTEKKETGHTEVYSLIDFKGLNRLSSIQKAYNFKRFGAFPQINFHNYGTNYRK